MNPGTGRLLVPYNQWGNSEFCTGRGWDPGMILTSYPPAAGEENWNHGPRRCLNRNGGGHESPLPQSQTALLPIPTLIKRGLVGKASGVHRREKQGSSLCPDKEVD